MEDISAHTGISYGFIMMNYFAFGSNMNPDGMKGRGVNFSKRVGARLYGYRLEFNKLAYGTKYQGFANITSDPKGLVEGVLYEISEKGLKTLDEYEGYPEYYGRITVEVELDDGTVTEAIAYIAQPDKTGEGLKPSRIYLAQLLAGEDLLSTEYVRRLRSTETVD